MDNWGRWGTDDERGTLTGTKTFVADAAGVVFLIGVIWAVLRRYVQRPYRLRLKTRPEDALILGTFLTIGVTGFLVQALHVAEAGRHEDVGRGPALE